MSKWKISTGKTWENLTYAIAEKTGRGFTEEDPGRALMPHIVIRAPGFDDLEFRKGTSLQTVFDDTWNRIRPQRGGDSDYLRDIEVVEEIPGGKKKKRKRKKRIPQKYRNAPYDVIERIVYDVVHVERYKIHFRDKGRFAVRYDYRLRGIDGRFVSGKAKR